MGHRLWIGTLALGICMGLALPGSAEAQNTLWGDWFMVVEVPATCTWEGPATFTETGADTFEGVGNLALTFGTDPPCPPAIAGTVTGSISGNQVMFGLDTPLGPVNFDGILDNGSLSGSWTFGNLAGNWSATRVDAAPSLPEWGLLAMLTALLAGGVYFVRRRASSSL